MTNLAVVLVPHTHHTLLIQHQSHTHSNPPSNPPTRCYNPLTPAGRSAHIDRRPTSGHRSCHPRILRLFPVQPAINKHPPVPSFVEGGLQSAPPSSVKRRGGPSCPWGHCHHISPTFVSPTPLHRLEELQPLASHHPHPANPIHLRHRHPRRGRRGLRDHPSDDEPNVPGAGREPDSV